MTDDGLGKKETETYRAVREGEEVAAEWKDGVVEDVAGGKKTFVNKGR